ncbi:MAG: alpha/beta hydrolase [Bacteroidales bacterium]|nr:alpha/beta hydrolase [Bacteroidales bacterium]
MCWANHAKKNLVITLTAIQGGKKEVITKKVRIKGPSSGNSGVSRFRLWRERQQAKRDVARAEYHYAWNSMKKWKKFLWIGLMALTIVMIVLSITKGCASAAMCLASHPDDFEGLVLLAAYSTKDLSKSGKKVISIYGSNDGVLNMKKYNEYMKNLPEDGVKGKFSGKATLLGKATKRGSSQKGEVHIKTLVLQTTDRYHIYSVRTSICILTDSNKYHQE